MPSFAVTGTVNRDFVRDMGRRASEPARGSARGMAA